MKRKNTKLRILALVDPGLVPPAEVGSRAERDAGAWRMEYDVVSTLRKLRHEVRCVEVNDDLSVIRQAISEQDPHVVFNMFEQFADNALFDQHVVSYLELLGVPYTGCNPRGLTLARDKALSKKVLSYHRILVPQFHVFPRGHKVRGVGRLKFPLFVKSLVEEGSAGISRASIVHDERKLRERVAFVHESVGTAAIAEEYIEGRELYVAVMGNRRLETFPVWELFFENLPPGAPAIATDRVKWSAKHQEKLGVYSGPAEGLSAAMLTRISQLSKRIYRALCLSGYARLDFRLRDDGALYLLEANPNPDISHDEAFCESSYLVGYTYRKLLQHILQLGLRWTPGSDG